MTACDIEQWVGRLVPLRAHLSSNVSWRLASYLAIHELRDPLDQQISTGHRT
jgi:hypothetical protein